MGGSTALPPRIEAMNRSRRRQSALSTSECADQRPRLLGSWRVSTTSLSRIGTMNRCASQRRAPDRGSATRSRFMESEHLQKSDVSCGHEPGRRLQSGTGFQPVSPEQARCLCHFLRFMESPVLVLETESASRGRRTGRSHARLLFLCVDHQRADAAASSFSFASALPLPINSAAESQPSTSDLVFPATNSAAAALSKTASRFGPRS